MLHGDGLNPIIVLETNAGDIPIELFEDDAPLTVDNFMNYVEDGDYINSFFHRLVSGFVLQGGGFASSSEVICEQPCAEADVDPSQFSEIPTDPPVVNEFGRSNVRRTVAMAKRPTSPDTATNQFFVNLRDNSQNLDNQNGGFTVFGQVVDMSAVNHIAALPTANISSVFPFNSPLQALAALPFENDPTTDARIMVRIENVSGMGVLHGSVFLDNDGDGNFDSTEGGMEGRMVYLDLNVNGTFDEGEPRTNTNNAGDYHFLVDPGTYTVRLEGVASFTSTVDMHTASVTMGRSANDLDLGLKYAGLSWQNPLTATDVNGINGTSAIDPLQIINELDNREFSDATTGVLEPLNSSPTVPRFFDVDGNGLATAIDALVAINALPSESSAPSSASSGSANGDDRTLDVPAFSQPIVQFPSDAAVGLSPGDDAEESEEAVDSVFAQLAGGEG